MAYWGSPGSGCRPAPGTRPTGCSAAGQGLEEEAGGLGPTPKLAATEARKLSQAQTRVQKQLRRAGIEARKRERLWKKSIAQLTKSGLPIPPELEDPITDPEAKSGSQYESATEGGSGRGSESERENEEVIIL
ncbi:hypothetical protein GMDG_07474 [Pseudogymnoascus destructans 20631-21]|uniref:Uncharacterized protein n=1 Tax=Pseudogymnoascus destructans (strain ATCC MYA-4855 / 20631-21) TaxID=658429 RepID=L8FYE0_PSED2|nr:hypothetical protein GMDG_07474 [Pseudogymnoascus destructans 20631-21]